MPWFSFHLNDFAYSFLSVLFEGIPFLLLGSLISGLIDVFISADRLQRFLPKNAFASIAISGLLGLILPICECGSVVVIRRFIRKGFPLSSAVTYMLAAPIVGPLVALSTFAAFKGQNPWLMTSLRLSIGYLVALTVGLIVHRLPSSSVLRSEISPPQRKRAGLSVASNPNTSLDPNSPPENFANLVASSSLPKKLLLSVQSATADFLDVAFYFIIGSALASLFNTAVKQEIIIPLASNPLLSIVSMMGLASLLALCSTTDAFIAASFTAFSFASKLAFLLFGPVFDLKLFWLYGILFNRRFIALLSLGLFIAITLICWRISALHLDDPRPVASPSIRSTLSHE
jgi:uncharacterized membrane protein YraQ (UPF0718 family)